MNRDTHCYRFNDTARIAVRIPPMVAAIAMGLTIPSAYAQPNDDCTGAVQIFDGTNVFDIRLTETLDPTAPLPCDGTLVTDVWYVYEATCTGLVTFDTCDASFPGDNIGPDTVMEVFDGDACPPMKFVGCGNDSDCGRFGYSSIVTLPCTAGQRFLIRLSEFRGDAAISGLLTVTCVFSNAGACCLPDASCVGVTGGQVECNIVPGGPGVYLGDGTDCADCPPANDTCVTATSVICDTGTISGLTLDWANPDYTLFSELSCTGSAADGPDVVFTFTSHVNTLVNAGMANVSGFDAAFYVVTDCFDPTAACVAGDNSGGNEQVTFSATAGTTYFLIADSFTPFPNPGTSFDFFITCIEPCMTCPGDMNGDNFINGADIQSFIGCYVSDFGQPASTGCGCADVLSDDAINVDDLTGFVALLLGNSGICNSGRCCYDDAGMGACAITDKAGCDALNGVFEPGVRDCPGPMTGACCNPSFGCGENVTECECVAGLNGVPGAGFFIPGGSCAIDCVAPINDRCETAIPVDCATGTLIGLSLDTAIDDYSPTRSSCTGFSSADGGDIAYSLNLPVNMLVTVSMTNVTGGQDSVIYVLSPDCTNVDLNCVAGADNTLENEDETLTFFAMAGSTYYIIADAWKPAPIGSRFNLSIQCETGPPGCPHTLTMFDSFGDGWTFGVTNRIRVFVNNDLVGVFTGLDSESSEWFFAQTGDIITTTYTGGDGFEEENSWQITDGFGNLVCEDLGGPFGPDTTAFRSCGFAQCP